MYLGAPVVSAFLQRFPRQRRWIQFGGLILMIAGLLASSFASRVWHLILTQGIVFGIAGTLLYHWSPFKYSGGQREDFPRLLLKHFFAASSHLLSVPPANAVQ